MKIWVIGHPEAVEGFSLVGVDGIAAETAEAVNQALDRVLSTEGVGIVMITDDSAQLVRERIDRLKNRVGLPLFLEVPDPNGMDPERMSLAELANQAIGIRRD